jgi:hypothetical protein
MFAWHVQQKDSQQVQLMLPPKFSHAQLLKQEIRKMVMIPQREAQQKVKDATPPARTPDAPKDSNAELP